MELLRGTFRLLSQYSKHHVGTYTRNVCVLNTYLQDSEVSKQRCVSVAWYFNYRRLSGGAYTHRNRELFNVGAFFSTYLSTSCFESIRLQQRANEQCVSTIAILL